MKHTMMCNYCGKILEITIEIKDGENIKHQCPKCGIFIVAETGRKECYKCGTELTEIGKIDDLEKIGIICQDCQERIDKQIKEHLEIVKDGGIYFRCLKCKTNGVIRPHNKICKEVRERLGAPIPEACGIEIESCYNCEDKSCCKSCEECKECKNIEKSIAYKEAGVLVCDSCGEALNECYSCVEEFKDNQEIYCEEIKDKDCRHYCSNCAEELKIPKKGKEPAYNLKEVSFPECASTCAVIGYFGVGECESVCSWKFHKDGKPMKKIEDSGDFESDCFLAVFKLLTDQEEKDGDDSWYDKIAKRDFERDCYKKADQEE